MGAACYGSASPGIQVAPPSNTGGRRSPAVSCASMLNHSPTARCISSRALFPGAVVGWAGGTASRYMRTLELIETGIDDLILTVPIGAPIEYFC